MGDSTWDATLNAPPTNPASYTWVCATCFDVTPWVQDGSCPVVWGALHSAHGRLIRFTLRCEMTVPSAAGRTTQDWVLELELRRGNAGALRRLHLEATDSGVNPVLLTNIVTAIKACAP
jgi:hypothetical protein